MRRREFIMLGGAAAAWPLAARAQQPTMPVIGFLNSEAHGLIPHLVSAFRHGLSETGHVEHQNVAIEYRWAEGRNERLPALAADLVRRQVSAIAVFGNPAVLAVKAVTSTVPVVFNTGVDPVESGLVASLNRPGSNFTGVTTLNVEVAPKRLELLHELVPAAAVVGLLVNPVNRNAEILSRDLQAAARSLGLRMQVLYATTERDFDTVFATVTQRRVGALVIGPDGYFIARSKPLAEMTVRHGVPTIFQTAAFVAAGGLMSYAGKLTEIYRQVGVYAGRILSGAKPSDLPVVQPTKFELVINLKTAKALGLEIPPTLLARADEVIE